MLRSALLQIPVHLYFNTLKELKKDYLIIGQGIAGTVLALELHRRGKSVVIMSKEGKSWSSSVAAGVYNPFNFRRMIPTWKAKETVELAKLFYTAAEKITNSKFHTNKEIIRPFATLEERKMWENYAAQEGAIFADNIIREQVCEGKLNTPYGAGFLNDCGVVNTALMMHATREFFTARNEYKDEWFEASKLEIRDDGVVYDNRITVTKIVFCEGHLALGNELFSEMPIAPTKGEVLHVSIPGLGLNEIVNGAVYLSSIGNDLYICGATFDPGKSDDNITTEAKAELEKKLSELVTVPFRVESQFAGVRPAGLDRKPFIGLHPQHPQIAIFNGTSSKGILLSPFLAQLLADHMESGEEIPIEIDFVRFSRRKSRR